MLTVSPNELPKSLRWAASLRILRSFTYVEKTNSSICDRMG